MTARGMRPAFVHFFSRKKAPPLRDANEPALLNDVFDTSRKGAPDARFHQESGEPAAIFSPVHA